MSISNGDIVRTTANFTLPDGTLYQNVFHHQRTGVGIISDAAHVTAIEAWLENMYNEIITYVKSTTTEALCSVDRVAFSIDAWEVVENIGVFTPDFNPAGGTNQLPNQVSPYVIFKTERPKSVGRKFLFPFIEEATNASILEEAAIEDIVAWADDAVNSITLQALDYLVPGIPRTGVDSWLPFTLAVVTNIVGSQRRRRPGVGA